MDYKKDMNNRIDCPLVARIQLQQARQADRTNQIQIKDKKLPIFLHTLKDLLLWSGLVRFPFQFYRRFLHCIYRNCVCLYSFKGVLAMIFLSRALSFQDYGRFSKDIYTRCASVYSFKGVLANKYIHLERQRLQFYGRFSNDIYIRTLAFIDLKASKFQHFKKKDRLYNHN